MATPKRVLIVDDSRVMRLMIRRSLRQAGFEDVVVTEAADGQEALTAALASLPDLVLADWNMPVMGGLELLEKMNEAGLPARLGFITSEQGAETRTLATEAGALFVLNKPFSPATLRAKVGAYLRRP